MAAQYVCPYCGSKKFRKEQEDDEDYCCDDCLEFFTEPKTITDEKPREKKEGKEMALDKEKLKELHAQGKPDKEIAEALNAKVGTVWAARKSLGLTTNSIYKPRKSSNGVEKPAKFKTKAIVADVSIVDQLMAERNRLQEKVFKINQAIELLS